jgi:hypothetical protein
MKRWLVVLLAVAVVAAGAGFAFRKKPVVQTPRPLNILFTCDVHGRLVPCGCFTGQLGGLTRIATLFGLQDTPDELRVDVGDALAGTADYERIQYRYIQDAFAKMHYDALNIGQREAALSATQLRAIKAETPVPMISANLLDKATGTPLFDTHRIVLSGGWRVALIGVLDPQTARETLGEGLALEEMNVALGKLVPKLRGQADFIVLLAFADEAGLSALAKQFYELNIILGGKVQQPSQKLLQDNRSFILATTNEARAIGTLSVQLLAPGKMEALKGEVVLVSDRIPQEEAIAELAAAYRGEVRKTRLEIDDPAKLAEDMVPGVKATATYAGTQSCASCHPSAMKVWRESGHAQAFRTLLARKADADPNCIGCHTVGFGTPSGYRREFGASKLIDVGCESCHGPGSQHVEQRLAGSEVTARFHPVGGGDCRKCHHGEFSRPFDFDKFWPAVAHGKESANQPAIPLQKKGVQLEVTPARRDPQAGIQSSITPEATRL